MKHRRMGWMIVALGLLGLIAGLAACSSVEAPTVVHIEAGAEETQTAQTAIALANPSATPGPSPTPTATSTPYVLPTRDPAVDGSMVITRVGNEEITLDEFQKRVRFERWFRLWSIARLAERNGVEKVLDLRRSENAYVMSMLSTLADSNSFGIQVQRLMTIEEIALQEAARRDLDVNPFQYDAKVGEYLGLQLGSNGERTPEFDTRYDDFIEQMKVYTGMTEADFRRIARAQTLYTQLQFLISQEPEALPDGDEAQIGVEVQDILVDNEVDGYEVVQRLEAGDPMRDIAADMGKVATGDTVQRVLRRSDTVLPEDVILAVLAATPGDIVGPLPTSQGWYVAQVNEPVYDVLTPADIESLRKQHFLRWVEGRMDDPAYVEDYDNWFKYIPQAPLPKDVSPLLNDENFIMPEGMPLDPYLAPLAEDATEEASPATPEATQAATEEAGS